MDGLEYDYVIIDTAPTYDNVIVNIFMASDMLIVPIQQDIFNYQSVKYLFGKLSDLELDNLDTHLVFNQYDKPRSDNKAAFTNQVTDLFLEDPLFKDFISPCLVSKSANIKKYINSRDFRLNSRQETVRQYEEVKNLVQSMTGIAVKEAV